MSVSSGAVSPQTTVAPAEMIPAFSWATSASVGPMISRWSAPTLVMTATAASTTLVASQRPPMPTSITLTWAAEANQLYAAAAITSK